MSEHLERAFTTYVQATLPSTALPAQRARARRDFYAGATALMTLLAQNQAAAAADGTSLLAQVYEELETYITQRERAPATERPGA